DCTSDAQCKTRGASLVCDPIACTCSNQKTCVPGCTSDMQCADGGQRCDLATARCVAQACSVPADCAPNFDCRATTCTRRPWPSDLECDGFCVDGACFAQTGTCVLPVP